jgi:hypothetical protein
VKKPKRLWSLLFKMVLVTALLGCFLYRENNALKLSVDEVHLLELPDALDGLRIIHLSDLHSKWFGSEQQKLVALIEKQEPHAIAITGDAIDARSKDEQPVLTLIRRLSPIAPLLYINGNHETKLRDLEGFLERARGAGALVLESDSVTVPFGDGEIIFVGMADRGQSSITPQWLETEAQKAFAEVMPGSFVVLLVHRPEVFTHYALLPANLILAGHAHGGQFRLPLIGGLYAPGQGFFPRFDSGLYRSEASGEAAGPVIIVSRGLGNSIFPQRLFNRPDVRLVILRKK